MKRVTVSVLCLAFALAANLAAQTGPPERLPGKGDLTSVSFTPEARIESSVVLSPEVSLAPAACTPNATTYCANGNRFQVSVIFSAPSLGLTNAPAQAVPLTGDTGYFWFFSSNNVELVIKVVDGRAFNGFFWVFFGALSDVTYTITVTDMDTGAVKVYTNAQGTLASVADTAAFPGGSSCSYTVSAANPASFGSGGGSGTVSVTTSSGCAWTATSNSSFLSITSGASGNGNGTVFFSLGANSSASSRSGTLTVAGQTVTISQSGASSGGTYDGSWSGTTSQTCTPSSGAHPCGVGWTIANTAFTRFELHYAGPACGIVDGGTTITYGTPRAITGTSFTITSTGSPPVRVDFTVNATFSSSSFASGSGSVTLTTSSPLASCTTTVPITFSATKL